MYLIYLKEYGKQYPTIHIFSNSSHKKNFECNAI